MLVLTIILFIISIIITTKICRILFRNTIGTSMAYMTRAFIVWIIVMGMLAALCNYIGLF